MIYDGVMQVPCVSQRHQQAADGGAGVAAGISIVLSKLLEQLPDQVPESASECQAMLQAALQPMEALQQLLAAAALSLADALLDRYVGTHDGVAVQLQLGWGENQCTALSQLCTAWRTASVRKLCNMVDIKNRQA